VLKQTYNRRVKVIKNSQPFGKMSENHSGGGDFLTHTVINISTPTFMMKCCQLMPVLPVLWHH